jgi:asparagine synthase (glutamine-hydrolysing)
VASLRVGEYGLGIGCAGQTGDIPQIAKSEKFTVAIDGSFFEHPESRASDFLSQMIANAPSTTKAMRATFVEIGGFAGVVADKERVYAFRDINGLKPLYYSHTRALTAFASERKALWRIHARNVQRVTPGNLYTLTGSSLRKVRVAEFKRPAEKKITLDYATDHLQILLTRSIQRITKRVGRLAVAFSGGLDSALTGVLAKRLGTDVQAVSVGLPGSSELSTAEDFAKRVGLAITVETFQPDLIEEYVRRVLWLIEEPNLMKVSVAVPLHWAAQIASRRGCKVMLCGQGSDELYGGYAKYARTLGKNGRGGLVRELYQNVIESSQINYERDDQACGPFHIELRTPFSDPDLIRFSLTIPSQFKVKDENDVTRKWILREVAKREGLPDEIVWRRKKAIQHGTGVENAIRRIAKRKGLSVDVYLSKLNEEVIKLESMP